MSNFLVRIQKPEKVKTICAKANMQWKCYWSRALISQRHHPDHHRSIAKKSPSSFISHDGDGGDDDSGSGGVLSGARAKLGKKTSSWLEESSALSSALPLQRYLHTCYMFVVNHRNTGEDCYAPILVRYVRNEFLQTPYNPHKKSKARKVFAKTPQQQQNHP